MTRALTIKIDNDILLTTRQVVSESVPECWLPVNCSVSDQSARIDATEIGFDISGGGLYVCYKVRKTAGASLGVLTGSIGV
jgi:hypothetical protein